jgi:hypothetical protein
MCVCVFFFLICLQSKYACQFNCHETAGLGGVERVSLDVLPVRRIRQLRNSWIRPPSGRIIIFFVRSKTTFYVLKWDLLFEGEEVLVRSVG